MILNNLPMRRFPRTPHIEGSRLQAGDRDLSQVPFSEIAGLNLIIEEKVDGANAGLSFSAERELRLQSRGHYLAGGPRERHFAMFKTWASCHQWALWERLRDRYLVYGEWMYARHTVFYDTLPAYFLEFDVYDRQADRFLSTDARAELLDGLPIHSVPILHRGTVASAEALRGMVAGSQYRSTRWREAMTQAAEAAGQDVARLIRETDSTDLAEGLYLKREEGGAVVGRYKWVRAGFHDTIAAAGGHWLDRPILPNGLAEGVDIFATDR
ncbi:MAG: hypothetical protein ACI8RZ_003245 [Myxococcota bacterium]|jgi:hypothetical protein